MKYVSIFSGIEAASVAWEPLGWEPLAFAEIEPFPCKVLAHRFPNVPNLGDVTQIDWSPYRGTVDVLVGGSPCQAFSVSGHRGGLDDPRGRLMLEFVRAVHDIQPRWLVWENVPGVLSQDGGRAFGTLLGALDDLGYGLAWRVLDAQFYGVAQRRRRVFLVGGVGAGRAAAVLFEPGSVPGSASQSRAKREALTRAAGEGAEGEGGCMNPWDVQSHRIYDKDGASPSLCSAEKRDNLSPVVAFAQNSRDEVRLVGGNGDMVGAICANHGAKQQNYVIAQYGEVAGSLTARYDSSPCADRGKPILFMENGQVKQPVNENVTNTLTAHLKQEPGILYAPGRFVNSNGTDTVGALCAADEKKLNSQTVSAGKLVGHEEGDEWIVRRITPLECERLQGFPDNWTGIPGAKDGPRYKALGNSMAVPVMRWIGERIMEVEEC